MLIQHTKWLQHAADLPWRAPVASLNVLLTSTCWRNDHNGFSHQGPGLIDTAMPLAPDVVRVWLPPDANCTLSIADHCLRSRDHVNLIVVDKQSHLQYLTLDEANAHCAAGAVGLGLGRHRGRASPGHPDEPDIVLAAAGDVPTLEILAAAQLLRDYVPYLRVRVVNVVDLMALLPAGRPSARLHRREVRPSCSPTTPTWSSRSTATRGPSTSCCTAGPTPGRFHVRGFNEQGTTTTPFDMVVLNRMSRYHLVLEALRRSRRAAEGGERARPAVRGDAGAAPRLRPRAPRGHAGGHRLDLAADERRRRPLGRRAGGPRASTPARRRSRPRCGPRELRAGRSTFERLDTTASTQAVRPTGGTAGATRGSGPTTVAHRVVHGGPNHQRHDARRRPLLDDLRAAVPLAPLHLPGTSTASRPRGRPGRDAVHVACFDTGFHAEPAGRVAPAAGRGRAGRPRRAPLRLPRSVGPVGPARRAPTWVRPSSPTSAAAAASPRSPTGGRGTRRCRSRRPAASCRRPGAGDLDPEIVLYLIEECGYGVADLRELLDRRSGLAGLADGSARRPAICWPRQPTTRTPGWRSTSSSIRSPPRWPPAPWRWTGSTPWSSRAVSASMPPRSATRVCRRCSSSEQRRSDPSADPVAALESTGIRVLVVPADEQAVMDDEARRLLASPSGATALARRARRHHRDRWSL